MYILPYDIEIETDSERKEQLGKQWISQLCEHLDRSNKALRECDFTRDKVVTFTIQHRFSGNDIEVVYTPSGEKCELHLPGTDCRIECKADKKAVLMALGEYLAGLHDTVTHNMDEASINGSIVHTTETCEYNFYECEIDEPLEILTEDCCHRLAEAMRNGTGWDFMDMLPKDEYRPFYVISRGGPSLIS